MRRRGMFVAGEVHRGKRQQGRAGIGKDSQAIPPLAENGRKEKELLAP